MSKTPEEKIQEATDLFLEADILSEFAQTRPDDPRAPNALRRAIVRHREAMAHQTGSGNVKHGDELVRRTTALAMADVFESNNLSGGREVVDQAVRQAGQYVINRHDTRAWFERQKGSSNASAQLAVSHYEFVHELFTRAVETNLRLNRARRDGEAPIPVDLAAVE